MSAEYNDRAVEALAAFHPSTRIHRGHLVAWGFHRSKRDAYVSAFKKLFGGGQSALVWHVHDVAGGRTAMPDKGTAKQHIISAAEIERARLRLGNNRLPSEPFRDFMQAPSHATANVDSILDFLKLPTAVETELLYGQSLSPGGVFRVGKTGSGLAKELGRWKSAHAWAIRTREVESNLLWVARVHKNTGEGLKKLFRECLSDFRYTFRPGELYGDDWYFYTGDAARLCSELRVRSDKDLLRTAAGWRADVFYE